MTQRGRVVGLSGLVALVLAVGTGYQAVALVGFMALFLVGAAVLWTARSVRYSASRSLSHLRVEQNEVALSVLEITNTSTRASSPAIGRETVGSGSVELHVPRLAAGASIALEYAVPTDRRGVQKVGPIAFVIRDPYGLCEKSREVAGHVQVLVRPQTHLVYLPSRGRIRALDAGEADRSVEGSLTFHALREYVPGDDRRRIHWRTSARTGTLMVKQHIDMTRPEVLIAIDVNVEPGDAFEELIEFAASLAVCAIRVGHPVRMITSGGAEELFDGRDAEIAALDTLTVISASSEQSESTWLATSAARSGGSTAVVCSVDPEIAANAGQAMFAGRFGTVACIGISDVASMTEVGGAQIVSGPNAGALVASWNTRFMA